jgi:hypothetical protein
MQRRFRRIMTHCGCHECVTEDVYRTTPTLAGLIFGAESSYATGTNSVGARHNDYPDMGLDTTSNVLSKPEDAPNMT